MAIAKAGSVAKAHAKACTNIRLRLGKGTVRDQDCGSPRHQPPSGDDKITINGIDRTMKNYIGGKQARPDGGYSYSVTGKGGSVIGQAGIGNRSDIRNAVEAASKAGSWGAATAHNRAQVLYYLGENPMHAARTFVARLIESTGVSERKREEEFETALRRFSIMPHRPTSSTERFIPPSRVM